MQRSSRPAGPNTSCIEGLPGAATLSSGFFCGGAEGRDCCDEVPRRAKAGALLFARSCSETCALRPRSVLSVVALILRATRLKDSCKNSRFTIEVNSYLNIPLMGGGHTCGRQRLGVRASGFNS